MFERIIEHHSRIRPNALAVSDPRQSLTFKQLHHTIIAMERHLRKRAVSGKLVAILIGQPILHWVALIALTRMGCSTWSLAPEAVTPVTEQLKAATVDFVLADRPVAATCEVVVLHENWRSDQDVGPSGEWAPPVGPHATIRLHATSGSTGEAKLIPLTLPLIDRRLRNAPLLGPLGGGRLLAPIGIENWGGFIGPLISWATSGSVIFPPSGQSPWADILTNARPELLIASPMHLAQILASLPNDYVPYGLLRIVVAGGSMPPSLSAAVRARLSNDLFISYASTEAGFSSYGQLMGMNDAPGASGYVLPWSEVEIVDESGSVQPNGIVGLVRVRGEELASGYHESHSSQSDFRDGWFYPGDIGALTDKGMLAVLGRKGEVMNCGGVKIAPLPIEDALLRVPGVLDVAAVALAQPDGFDLPVAAIVIDQRFDLEAARRALAPLRHEISMVRVDAITRTAGLRKIMRDEVRRDVAARLIAGEALIRGTRVG